MFNIDNRRVHEILECFVISIRLTRVCYHLIELIQDVMNMAINYLALYEQEMGKQISIKA